MIAMAFVVPYMGELKLQIAVSIFGMVGGPLAGLSILGLFVPCCNAWVRYIIIKDVCNKFSWTSVKTYGNCFH